MDVEQEDNFDRWRQNRRIEQAMIESRGYANSLMKASPFLQQQLLDRDSAEAARSKSILLEQLIRLNGNEYGYFDDDSLSENDPYEGSIAKTPLDITKDTHDMLLKRLNSIFDDDECSDVESTPKPLNTRYSASVSSSQLTTTTTDASMITEIEDLQEKLRQHEISRKDGTFSSDIRTQLCKNQVDSLITSSVKESLYDIAKAALEDTSTSFELSDTDEQSFDLVFSGKSSSKQVLVSKFNVDMTRKDLQCLQNGVWLNDEVINFWIQMLQERDDYLVQEGKRLRKSHFYNSFFYAKLFSDRRTYDYASVKRWSRKFDTFALDKIFVPINVSNTHWCMAVIFVQEKRIQYYDSMNGTGKQCLDHLLRYLKDEYQNKKKGDLDESEWEIVPTKRGTPQQSNGSDCGVFSTMYAHFLSIDQELTFSQSDMPEIRRYMAAKIVQGDKLPV